MQPVFQTVHHVLVGNTIEAVEMFKGGGWFGCSSGMAKEEQRFQVVCVLLHNDNRRFTILTLMVREGKHVGKNGRCMRKEELVGLKVDCGCTT